MCARTCELMIRMAEPVVNPETTLSPRKVVMSPNRAAAIASCTTPVMKESSITALMYAALMTQPTGGQGPQFQPSRAATGGR